MKGSLVTGVRVDITGDKHQVSPLMGKLEKSSQSQRFKERLPEAGQGQGRGPGEVITGIKAHGGLGCRSVKAFTRMCEALRSIPSTEN